MAQRKYIESRHQGGVSLELGATKLVGVSLELGEGSVGSELGGS